MDLSTLYWITRLDEIKEFLAFGEAYFGVFALTVLYVAIQAPLIFSKAKTDSEGKELFSKEFPPQVKGGLKFVATCYVLMSLSDLLSALVPTQKDVALMVGLHTITNNEEAKKLPDNVLKTVNDYLESLQDGVEETKVENN